VISPKVLYTPVPPKKTFVSGKISYLCREKLCFWALAPDHLNRVSAPGPPWGTAPTPSSGANPMVYTMSGHSQFLAMWCQNIMCKCAKTFSFWALGEVPGALPLDHTGDFRSSNLPASGGASCRAKGFKPLLPPHSNLARSSQIPRNIFRFVKEYRRPESILYLKCTIKRHFQTKKLEKFSGEGLKPPPHTLSALASHI